MPILCIIPKILEQRAQQLDPVISVPFIRRKCNCYEIFEIITQNKLSDFGTCTGNITIKFTKIVGGSCGNVNFYIFTFRICFYLFIALNTFSFHVRHTETTSCVTLDSQDITSINLTLRNSIKHKYQPKNDSKSSMESQPHT